MTRTSGVTDKIHESHTTQTLFVLGSAIYVA